MDSIKQRLLTNWHLMRIIRMVIGIGLGIMALQSRDGMMGLFSAFFLFQGITDTGCCGTAGCAAPPRAENKRPHTPTDIEYEEIK